MSPTAACASNVRMRCRRSPQPLILQLERPVLHLQALHVCGLALAAAGGVMGGPRGQDLRQILWRVQGKQREGAQRRGAQRRRCSSAAGIPSCTVISLRSN